MSCWEVNDYLSELMDIDESEKELCMRLSKSSLNEIEAKLRSDVDTEDFRITAAAATLAYYKYMLRKSGSAESEHITSFKAGDVDVKQEFTDTSKNLEKAESFYKNALAELVPLCDDNCFAFENVEVKIKI